MKYHIKTFGCQMNENDSKRIANYLEKNNYEPAPSIEKADLIIINMCSVRQSAVDRIHGLIPKFKKLKEENPDLKTILTGCVLKKDQSKLKQEFDYILSKKTLQQWDEFLQQDEWTYHPDPRNEKFNQQYDAEYLKIDPKYEGEGRAYLPISTGCDNFCSFCVVPYTRGPEICRDPDEILKEAEQLIKKGVKELWLLGQNVNSYQHSKTSFADLIKKINEIKGDFWLKYTSSNPKDFNQESIRKIAETEKVAPYLNLPLQSGDDQILKKMNRPYSVSEYKKVAETFREEFDLLSLSTDIIVGFPGETEEQFKNTVKAFKEINFDMAYVAKYSPRPQTQAANLKDNVPQEEKDRREKILTDLLKKQSLKFNQNLVGKTMKVIVLEKKEKLIGKNKYNKTVKLTGPEELINKFATVEIKEAFPWNLIGELKQ